VTEGAAGRPAPASEERRWLVPRAHRPLPVLPILAVPVVGAVYLIAAVYNPVIGPSRTSVVVLTALAMLTFAYTLMSRNADILDPMRVLSFYFLIIFCIAPLAAEGIAWHYTRPFHELLPGPVLYCLFAYVMMLVGYHSPTFATIPERIERRSNVCDPRAVGMLGVALFIAGFLSWVGIMIMTGGTEDLVHSDKARGEFFYGFGYFFWGAIFMYPGALLYWAARVEVSRRHLPWRHIVPILITFGCFFVLQGRMRSINILILAMFCAHYLFRPLRPARIGLFGAAGLAFTIFIGVARAPSTRAFALENPTALLMEIFVNFEDVLRGFLLGDLSRLRQLVLIMDKVPAWMSYDWGQSLLLFLNPWVRLLGFEGLQTSGIGPRLFQLAHPAHPGLPTGYLPSILGEMIVNFPWFVSIWFFIPFGMALKAVYNALIVRRGDFVSVALYAALVLQMANMLLQSLGHVIFELALITVPILLVRRLTRRQQRFRYGLQGAIAPPQRSG